MAIELFAYGDESGLHQNPPYCIVSGYIGSPFQWKKFEQSWLDILARYEVGDIHSADFFHRDDRGQRLKFYSEWSDAKADRFLHELLGIIQQRSIYPIGAAVDVNSFKALGPGIRRFLTGGALKKKTGKWKGSTGTFALYHLAFQVFLSEAAKKASDDATVHFRFDQQNVLQEHAIALFHRIATEQRHPDWRGSAVLHMRAGSKKWLCN